jgi:hypothetical protein
MADEPPPTQRSSPKERSPGYPGIDLEQAIARADQLYRAERRNAAPISVVLGHWGYTSPTGPGAIALSALKKFGLLQDEGSSTARKARLTDETVASILLRQEEDPVRKAAIRDAALRPKIYAELWKLYEREGLPSEMNLALALQRERGFSASGASAFITAFRRTLDFAGLLPGATIDDSDHDSRLEDEGNVPMSVLAAPVQQPISQGTSLAPGQRTVQIPLGSQWASLQAAFPLTEETWTLMLRVLDAMKPGLIRQTDEPPEEGSQLT